MLERYNSMLGAIQALDATAHIAGGAVRDTLLERPIRDVDVFLSEGATNAAAGLLRSQFGFVKVGEWESYEVFSDPAVSRVAKFEKADETIPVCLIGLKHPRTMQENLARFDFGVCMAGWDGEEVYTAEEYKTDIERQTFTLCRADNQTQFNYSMSRFEKMTADRYAGWQLVVPAKFEAMAKEHALRKTHYYDDDTTVWKLRDLRHAGADPQSPLTIERARPCSPRGARALLTPAELEGEPMASDPTSNDAPATSTQRRARRFCPHLPGSAALSSRAVALAIPCGSLSSTQQLVVFAVISHGHVGAEVNGGRLGQLSCSGLLILPLERQLRYRSRPHRPDRGIRDGLYFVGYSLIIIRKSERRPISLTRIRTSLVTLMIRKIRIFMQIRSC